MAERRASGPDGGGRGRGRKEETCETGAREVVAEVVNGVRVGASKSTGPTTKDVHTPPCRPAAAR
eukprot:2009984-Pyramimonas_sp.AAC.1